MGFGDLLPSGFSEDTNAEGGGLSNTTGWKTTQTTDGSAAILCSVLVPVNTTYHCKFYFTAVQDDLTNRGSAEVDATIYRAGGSAQTQGDMTLVHAQMSNQNWHLNIVPNGNNVDFQVFGDTGQTVNWTGLVTYF